MRLLKISIIAFALFGLSVSANAQVSEHPTVPYMNSAGANALDAIFMGFYEKVMLAQQTPPKPVCVTRWVVVKRQRPTLTSIMGADGIVTETHHQGYEILRNRCTGHRRIGSYIPPVSHRKTRAPPK
jgi:hypothetical protein